MAKRSTERSAACATCGKTFARSDTLLRHEKSHLATDDRGPVHRVTDGTFRACGSCAQARSRCSGGMPCGRCNTRNLECVYPSKRRKANSINDNGQMSFSTLDMSSNSQTEPLKLEQQLPGQFQQFVFPSTSSAPYPDAGPPDVGSVNTVTDVPRSDPMQLKQPMTGQNHHPGTTQAMPFAGTNPQQLSPMEANLQGIIDVSRPMHNLDSYHNPPVPIDYPNAFDSQNATFGGNNMYDESLNLNWIPLSVYPSPYGNMDQDFSFLLPSLSDTASMSNGFDPMAFDAAMAATPGSGGAARIQSSSQYHPPASISGLMQSPASTNNSENVVPLGFAFDNVEIPGSKRKKRKPSQVSVGFSQQKDAPEGFSFPDMSSISLTTAPPLCSESNYASVLTAFQQLCVDSSRWKPFSTPTFPGWGIFNTCIELYFEYLHPTFPLIHVPTFEASSDWLTCLATAAIGCTFTGIQNNADAQEAFQEFLRRAVLTTSDEHDGDFRNIHLAQARILALISLTQSGRERLRSRVPRSHADIARWCLESSILQLTGKDEEVRSDENIEAAWHRWVQRESLRRVGYFIWYLDCALGYIGNARPLCNMDDARANLPCAEPLWNAPSAQEWLVHRNNTPPMPSLCAALETMYIKKKIDPGLSEISQILLIHALYSRTWEVGTHIKQPLSEWKSTGNSKGFLNTPSKDNFWLPIYPLYANWRNSACDCLDVLHWQAAMTMAKNSGAEHHGVLHLHLARIVLLTPFQEIQDLLFFLINHRVSDLSKASFYVHDGSYQPRNPDKLPQIRRITSRWLREDQHKARLAMIHAGSVFWHVRRHSTYSFFEPLAIYLASIVLWTYGSYKSFALGKDATGEATNGASTFRRQPHSDQQSHDRSSQVQSEPGHDANVQPTRVERAAQTYSGHKSHSSRSRSTQNTSTNASNSPMQTRGIPEQATVSINLYVPDTTTQPDQSTPHVEHSEQEDESPSSSDEDQPQFIYLDRPCDDEIVQHFVRNGHNMSGYMSNVGDICKTPQKVLLEGAKILRTKLACWGVSREYHDILMRLAEMRKDKDKDKGNDGNGTKNKRATEKVQVPHQM